MVQRDREEGLALRRDEPPAAFALREGEERFLRFGAKGERGSDRCQGGGAGEKMAPVHGVTGREGFAQGRSCGQHRKVVIWIVAVARKELKKWAAERGKGGWEGNLGFRKGPETDETPPDSRRLKENECLRKRGIPGDSGRSCQRSPVESGRGEGPAHELRPGNPVHRRSGQNPPDDRAVDVREAEISSPIPIGEALVVEA